MLNSWNHVTLTQKVQHEWRLDSRPLQFGINLTSLYLFKAGTSVLILTIVSGEPPNALRAPEGRQSSIYSGNRIELDGEKLSNSEFDLLVPGICRLTVAQQAILCKCVSSSLK